MGSKGSPAHAYIDGFDHSVWQILLCGSFAAHKSGARAATDVVPIASKKAEGVFWYQPILASASCAADPIGKPHGWENAEDEVQVAVLLLAAAAGATVNVCSGDARIGSYKGWPSC